EGEDRGGAPGPLREPPQHSLAARSGGTELRRAGQGTGRPQGHRHEPAVPCPAQDAEEAAGVSWRGRSRAGRGGTMKRCEDVVPLLGPLMDSALPEDDREWVEEHLRECAACRDRKTLIAAQ